MRFAIGDSDPNIRRTNVVPLSQRTETQTLGCLAENRLCRSTNAGCQSGRCPAHEVPRRLMASGLMPGLCRVRAWKWGFSRRWTVVRSVSRVSFGCDRIGLIKGVGVHAGSASRLSGFAPDAYRRMSASGILSLMMMLLLTVGSAAAESESIEELRKRIEQLEQRQQIQPENVRQRLAQVDGLAPAPPEAPTPADGPEWQLELQGYNRFRFNLYDNFSDTQVAPDGSFQQGSSASFNTFRKEDDRLRFSTLRGYATGAVKKGPFMAVVSLNYAGNNFNDGVLLGNDRAPMGPASQREFQVDTQLLYLQYNGWAQLRLGRQMNHVGNGIVGHIVRDSVTALKQWTDRFSTQVTYVMGAMGRSIGGSSGSGISQTTLQKLNTSSGTEEGLDGAMLIFNYVPRPMNRLQFFLWRMWDTTSGGAYKQNQYLDANGSGRIGSMDYAFEHVYLSGTSPIVSENGSLMNGRRERNSAHLAYLDIRHTFGISPLLPERPDLLSLGATFGFGSGDNNPDDGRNRNFDSLFLDETGFRYNFLFSDDIHGWNGRGFDSRRGSGFTNVTFVQPYPIVRPRPDFQAKFAWTLLRSSVAQPAGTGVLGPRPLLNSALSYSQTPVGGPTKDIGQEFDVLMDYFHGPVRVFSYFGMFLPGRVYAPFQDYALKYEVGVEYRF